ncbi:MAG TPA: hypothetical protein VMC02_14470 [Steroidobacteraceae bacterium]|nr:hypothetical protein [Steroidobacteraceae bacterium]
MNPGDSRTSDRLERALQASLRPVDPGVNFTIALQARLASADLRDRPDGAAAGIANSGGVPRVSRRLHSASMGLAASLVAALAVGWQLQNLRAVERADQVRVQAQLLQALEITSERLSLTQRQIEQFSSQEKTP